MSNYCEDYPCCGHTPLDPCARQPYDEPGYFDTRRDPHVFCDHEVGYCDADLDDYEDEDEPEPEYDDDPGYWIQREAEAQLDQMEAYYGIEPSGWEDTTFPNEY